jgi:hypothetical protein
MDRSSCSAASDTAFVHFERRELTRALSCYLQALKEGEDPRLRVNERWACWMLLGEFERAWKESDQVGASFGITNPLESNHLLIRCLRGFGDAVHFLRYVETVKTHCDRLTVQAPAHFLPLLRILPGVDSVVPLGQCITESDYECCMECSDLPYLFRTTLDTIPPPLDLGSVAHPVSKTSQHMRVGIKWSAGAWNPTREIPLHLLQPIWELPKLQLISLEQNTEGRLVPHEMNETSIASDTTVFDTIGLISELDLVITVDTLIAHLAGSLGKPVWTLLQFASDWRWMLDRAESPWYPSMRLFRQPHPGNWEAVIEHVVAQLCEER